MRRRATKTKFRQSAGCTRRRCRNQKAFQQAGLYSAGTTSTLAFLSTPHAFQTRYGGGDVDGSAGKVDLSQPAGPELRSVVNAASLQGGDEIGAVAPGEIVTLLGNGFGSQPSVNFDKAPAPVLYVSNCQINAVVPFSLPGRHSNSIIFGCCEPPRFIGEVRFRF